MPKPIRFVTKEVNGRRFVEAIYYAEPELPFEFEPQVVSGGTNEERKPLLLSPLEPKKNTQSLPNSSPTRCGDSTKVVRLHFCSKKKSSFNEIQSWERHTSKPKKVYERRRYELDVKQIHAVMTILPCAVAEIEYFLFKRNATFSESRGLNIALRRMGRYNTMTYKWELK